MGLYSLSIGVLLWFEVLLTDEGPQLYDLPIRSNRPTEDGGCFCRSEGILVLFWHVKTRIRNIKNQYVHDQDKFFIIQTCGLRQYMTQHLKIQDGLKPK